VKIKHKNTNIKTHKKRKSIRTLDDHGKEHLIVRKESSKF
jgi:hypothetical protein